MDALRQVLEAIGDKVDEGLLMLEGVEATPPAPSSPAPAPSGDTRTIGWGKRVSPEFKAGVLWIQDQLDLDANKLMPCIAFETGGTFSPSIKNPASSAVGLIQFMDYTVSSMIDHWKKKGIDLSPMAPNRRSSDLAKLDAVKQLSWVFYYFKAFGDNLGDWSIEDVYMAILLPVMIGKPLDTPMKWNASAYRVNRGLDLDKNGTITKREASYKVVQLYHQGLTEEFRG